MAASARDESLPQAVERLRALVDRRLAMHFPRAAPERNEIEAAMAASVLSPGKRLRAVLTLLVVQAYGGDTELAADVACVPEMVHAASLVLDDLPCMDNAEVRRGQPTVHRRFGEAVAILAAFALLARAHALLPAGLTAAGVVPAHRATLEQRLAEVVAAMCRGQALDLRPLAGAKDLASLESVHAQKTGALFELAAELGAAAAGIRGPGLEPVLVYARNLGLAFQVGDDLLDAEGREDQLGKPTGRDVVLGRATFVGVFGTRGARAIRDELSAAAAGAIAELTPRGRLLRELAEYVRTRTS